MGDIANDSGHTGSVGKIRTESRARRSAQPPYPTSGTKPTKPDAKKNKPAPAAAAATRPSMNPGLLLSIDFLCRPIFDLVRVSCPGKWTVVFGVDMEDPDWFCYICQKQFDTADADDAKKFSGVLVTCTGCKKTTCLECAQEWTKEHATCPNCRQPGTYDSKQPDENVHIVCGHCGGRHHPTSFRDHWAYCPNRACLPGCLEHFDESKPLVSPTELAAHIDDGCFDCFKSLAMQSMLIQSKKIKDQAAAIEDLEQQTKQLRKDAEFVGGASARVEGLRQRMINDDEARDDPATLRQDLADVVAEYMHEQLRIAALHQRLHDTFVQHEEALNTYAAGQRVGPGFPIVMASLANMRTAMESVSSLSD